MAVYMIGYDLNQPGKDYKDVIQAIKDSSDGAWCHYWDSTWLIRTSLTVNQVTENITPFVDGSDRLIVIEVEKNYQGFLTEKQWDYIRDSIFA